MWRTFLGWLYGGQLCIAAVGVFAAIVLIDLNGSIDRDTRVKRAAGFVALLALVLAVFSAPPLSIVAALLMLTATSLYVVVGFGAHRTRRLWLGTAAAAACLAFLILELPWQLHRADVPRPTRLFVIGDSLASGGFEEQRPWPQIVGQCANVPVTNLALASADAAMALQREAPLIGAPRDAGECVLVEIGANDMEDGVPVAEFETNLDRLLASASAGDRRRLIMLEMPLLPGRWAYGAVQRRLAKKYHCAFVPKRILANVLLGDGMTIDGVHMTQPGHNEFARALCQWLGWDARSRKTKILSVHHL